MSYKYHEIIVVGRAVSDAVDDAVCEAVMKIK